VNGLKNGIEKVYNLEGKIESETPYVDGKMNGISKEYYENGILKTETVYEDDIPEYIGNVKRYDKKGKLIPKTEKPK
jgi:antitoxin component YwqK of YwqJK toxin-antitoxin module